MQSEVRVSTALTMHYVSALAFEKAKEERKGRGCKAVPAYYGSLSRPSCHPWTAPAILSPSSKGTRSCH
eukprot:1161722-Pelagomonas_calceolata.AAC.5